MPIIDGAQPDALPGQINGDALDRFTLAHAAAGGALGYVGLPWWAVTGTAMAWELCENTLKDRYPHLFPNATHDHPSNAVADTLAMMVGWGVVRQLRKR